MKNTMKKSLLLIVVLLTISNSFSQNAIWKKITSAEVTSPVLARESHPSEFLLYSLNMEVLKAKLATAPSRNVVGQESSVVIAFPNPQGEMQNFKIYEASVMHPELAAKNPEIQSYIGLGLEDKTAMIRFSTTIFGLHTMTFSGVNGTSYIDPYSKDLRNYMVYNRSSLTRNFAFNCGVREAESDLVPEDTENLPQLRASNSLFKTYRLALSCTIEYAAYHVSAAGLSGGTLAQKKAAVLAAMNVTMTRVNGVYERDMSLTMQLIANNDALINITSDNLDNNNSAPTFPLLDQNQTFVDATVGNGNYDIGHVATTGAGGVATLGCVCTSTTKARGVTGTDAPVGDPYDIDFVAHEMGHQFGGSHTFNSDQGNCSGNKTTSSAYEPGSGTTIMAYAGICSPQDVQLHSDAYLHARSLIQMIALVNGSANCAAAVPNGNTPPVVNAGGDFTIPFGTPFVLTGSATDVDSDALTYCWEQYNFNASSALATPTTTVGPNFRSFNPSASPKRYFPEFSKVLANNLTSTWEVVPSVARTLVFSLVVRDNRTPLGGQTQRATMNLVLANAGPFKVTSQSTPTAWLRNSTQTVTWDVAGTTANNINTALVNIKLSVDGGVTFPYVLAENTANDGTEDIVAPDVVSQNCRIMVEAVGNVFYALNTKTFNIGYEIVTTCNTYEFTTPFNLTDGSNSYTVKQINVPTAGVISDVNFTINATHPNLQNLVMAIIRPGGSIATYFNQQCTGSADMNVTFDQAGSTLTCASPTAGTYKPATLNLDTFNGFSQQGNWQFGFKDVVAGNAGTINSIALEVCSQTLVLANDTFEFDDFKLYPNPNDSNFTIQFNSNSSSKIAIAVHDVSGRLILNKSYSNTGLFNEKVKLDNAQAGIYLVTITDGEKKMVKRIVVQ
jgi:subtilisin-like proprotein convertase family protein